MKKRLTIPTLLGLLFLAGAIVTAVILVQKQQDLTSKADIEAVPQNVKVTNNEAGKFTVTWMTKIKASGTIAVSKNNGNSLVFLDSIGNAYVHSADATNLEANTDYSIRIISGSITYDNNSNLWQTKTVKDTATSQRNISGIVYTATGTPAKKVLVFVESEGMAPLSAITSDEGNYLIPVGNAQKMDLSGVFTFSDDTPLTLTVQAGPAGVAKAEIYCKASQNVPPMILGQIHDFKNLTGEEIAQDNPASAQLEVPLPSATPIATIVTSPSPESEDDTEETVLSLNSFIADETLTQTTSTTVTLDSLDEGEVISATRPEFFGTAPSKTAITITLESEMQTDNVTASSAGKWSWSPDKVIAEGSHKITLSWKNASGVLQTITRNFVVSAAEKNPGYVSTPSASISPNPEATLPPQPVSGVSTPFILLLGASIALIVGVGYLYRIANDQNI
jgi:hypothetical protein